MRKRRSILNRQEGPAHGSCERRAYRLEREKRSFFRIAIVHSFETLGLSGQGE